MRFRLTHLLLALAAVAIIATAVIYTVDRLAPTVSPDPLRAAIERHGLTVTGRGQSTGTIQLTSSYLAQVPGSLYQIACNKSGYDLTAPPDAEVIITKYPIAQRYQDVATNEPLDALVFHQGSRVLCIYKAVRGGAISPGVFGADEDTIAPFSSAPVGNQAVCTADAKQCPDGSYVSRVAPTCEFAACPEANSNTAANVNAIANTNATVDATADWKTYTNTQYGYSVRYPSSWTEPSPQATDAVFVDPGYNDSMAIEAPPQLEIGAAPSFENAFLVPGSRKAVTINGIAATQQMVGGLGSYVVTYFPSGNRFIRVMYEEGNETYSQILHTFTLTN